MPVKRMTSFIIFPPGSRSCSLMKNGGESMVDKTDAERPFSRLSQRGILPHSCLWYLNANPEVTITSMKRVSSAGGAPSTSGRRR